MPQRVLIVDDERSLRRTLTFVFGRAGCEVREAADGAEALEQLRDQPAELVVMDLMMPRKSGFEALQEIREDLALQGTRVMILTAKGQPEDRDRAGELGADAFLTKPFSPMEVCSRGRALLKLGPRSGAARKS